MIWTVAILLMATGHLAHAYDDLTSCVDVCTSEHASNSDTDSSCPVGNSCSHSHAHGFIALTDAPEFLFVSHAATSFPDANELLLDGPCREIDYPPQLS